MSWWSDRRVFLSGGTGFLGRIIRRNLEAKHPAALFAPPSTELDLRDAHATRAYLQSAQPNLVIHCAAVVGGIGANRSHPGRFFYENAIMRSEEHTSELQSRVDISYAVFCLKKNIT